MGERDARGEARVDQGEAHRPLKEDRRAEQQGEEEEPAFLDDTQEQQRQEQGEAPRRQRTQGREARQEDVQGPGEARRRVALQHSNNSRAAPSRATPRIDSASEETRNYVTVFLRVRSL